MLASSLLASPPLAIEYDKAPIRKEIKKCSALSFANHSSFLVAEGGKVFWCVAQPIKWINNNAMRRVLYFSVVVRNIKRLIIHSFSSLKSSSFKTTPIWDSNSRQKSFSISLLFKIVASVIVSSLSNPIVTSGKTLFLSTTLIILLLLVNVNDC